MEVMNTSMIIMSSEMDSLDNSSNDTIFSVTKPKRKRQRLDHLSHEEKLMRRKLKNRMAAQSARDRKKLKMNELEEDLILLTKQRNALLNQNQTLKQRNALLEQQNKELKERLSILESQTSETSVKVENKCSNDWSETFESAELISDPQPKEQVSHLIRQTYPPLPSMTPFVYWLIIKNLMLYSMFFTSILKNSSIQLKITTMAHNCRQSMTSNVKKLDSMNRHHIWDQLKT
jgi:X box-binding protein 1